MARLHSREWRIFKVAALVLVRWLITDWCKILLKEHICNNFDSDSYEWKTGKVRAEEVLWMQRITHTISSWREAGEALMQALVNVIGLGKGSER
eukprot:scaffold4423_cov159-Skeletonema_menzelii.AAC.2